MSDESNQPDEGAGNPFADLDAKYASVNTLDKVRAMAAVKDRKERGEEVMKEINREFDYLRLKSIPSAFEAEGIEKLTVEGVGRVSLTGDMYVSVRPDMKEPMHEWLRDLGKGSVIAEAVPSSTLKAMIKTMMMAGEEIPEQYIKVTPFTRASITKSK